MTTVHVTIRHVNEFTRQCSQQLRQALEAYYGSRLVCVLVFGSHARNEEGPESDIDVLVVLDQVSHYAKEIDATSEITSSLSMRFGKTISRVFIGRDQWERGNSIFLVNVRDEAVPA